MCIRDRAGFSAGIFGLHSGYQPASHQGAERRTGKDLCGEPEVQESDDHSSVLWEMGIRDSCNTLPKPIKNTEI